MHNLLLEEDKKKVEKEYLTRFFVTFFFLLAFVGGVLFLSLLPSDIFSWSKEKGIQGQKQTIDQSVLSLESGNLNLLLLEMKEEVESLRGGHSDLSLYEMIERILIHKNSGVFITSFTFQPENMKKRKISVQGVANSRDTLVEFSKRLEQENFFTVSLPVSNFAKQGNIDFTLDILVQTN